MEPAADTHPEARTDVEADRRASRSADLILTIVGLLVLAPVVLWFAWMGAWTGAVTGQCGVNVCNDGVIKFGVGTASLGPVIVWALALILSIVLLVRRRRASWVAPIAFLVAIGVLNLGAWLTQWGAGLV